MLGLQYTIVYRKGSDNTRADTLSRRPHQHAQVGAISSVRPVWIDELVEGYQKDPMAKALLE
jgi:hypothetical protein